MEKIKIFNKWDVEGVAVSDPGLKNYISVKPVIIPRTFGRFAKNQFHKSYMNIIERIVNHLYVSGHRGKKHTITSGKNVGKTFKIWAVIEDTLKILEEKAKKNPMEVLVKAVENAALREEITSFQVGGIIVRKAVITSPQRRVDLSIRHLVQGSYQRSFNNSKTMAQALAEELYGAYMNDPQTSSSIRDKERIEREAGGAR
ncbi:MAG: 30S ribosomal protein S7 [Candidatus Aenigmatarchaeota archaeon]